MIEKVKKLIILILLKGTAVLFSALQLNAQVQMNFEFETPYGNNEIVGKYAEINGTRIYYEEYGKGAPLLMIHGNGANIMTMGNQIDHFKTKYRLIVADSRGHGNSELNADKLTYFQLADDWKKLAEYLNLDSCYVLGWSDGGIVGLLLGIHDQNKVKKIVAMGANLRADTTAIYSWAFNAWQERQKYINTMVEKGDSAENWLIFKQRAEMMLFMSEITHSDLHKIKCPVLVMAGDQDIIREEHTLEIFQNIPNAHLCIMPGETHFTPASNPSYFNTIVEKFFAEPFSRPDSDLSINR